MKQDALHIRKGHKGFVAVDPETRFWAKVQKSDGDDCWNWTGSSQDNGYGSLYSGANFIKPIGGFTKSISDRRREPSIFAIAATIDVVCG